MRARTYHRAGMAGRNGGFSGASPPAMEPPVRAVTDGHAMRRPLNLPSARAQARCPELRGRGDRHPGLLGWRAPETMTTTRRTIGDLAVLGGLALALALGQFAVRGGALPLIAEEPEALCGLEEGAPGEDDAGGPRLAAAPEVPRIAADEAARLVGAPGVAFVDARGAHHYAGGHVPGALCLPVAEAAAILERSSVPLSPEDLVIAYCDSLACGDAEALSSLLREQLGCREVRVIDGGWQQWLASGGPITQVGQASASAQETHGQG